MKLDAMDLVFQALASRTRRRILDLLRRMPGCSVNELCQHFDMSRIAVMKHLRVLETAQLLVSQKSGRTRQLYFNVVPIQLIYDRWTDEYSAFGATQVADIKAQVESKPNKAASPKRPSRKPAKRTRIKHRR